METYKEASEKTVYGINYIFKNGHVVGYKVEETTLLDWVRRSAEELNGAPKLYVCEIPVNTDGDVKYQVRLANSSGKSLLISEHETEDDARNDWFKRTHDYDFMPDDQRCTLYYDTLDEANAYILEAVKDLMNYEC